MLNPPSDLLGFHVETAGSLNGPWLRLTKHPVAWWERSYVSQGVGVDTGAGFSGHTECLYYRVIAVDEDGNESAPALSQSTTCPTEPTPDPPKNLRASSVIAASGCTTRLDWDASAGATEYYVYRIVIGMTLPFFYQTQRIVLMPPNPLTTSYVEDGDFPTLDSDPDQRCAYQEDESCQQGALNAFYVTARKTSGGESPRSNLVFWKCSNSSDPAAMGYAKLLGSAVPTEAVASWLAAPTEDARACWLTDKAPFEISTAFNASSSSSPRARDLTMAPMDRLGSYLDPPWRVLDLHTDHLGSVRSITNVYGQLVSFHNYFPFGEEINPQFSYNTHQFTGHERDKDTGLDYMLARYYSSSLARFLSTDPATSSSTATDPQSWSRYSYVLNNPLKFVDPKGRCSAPAGGNGVCIEAFIAAPHVGFLGLGNGDNRGHSGTDPSLKSRVEIKIATDASSGTFDVKTTPGISSTRIPGVERPGSATTTITNGQTLTDGTMKFSVNVTALNGLSKLPFAPKEPIDMSINMEVSPDGQASIEPGSVADGYPSIGIYGYSDGEAQKLFTGGEGTTDDLAPPMERGIPPTDKPNP